VVKQVVCDRGKRTSGESATMAIALGIFGLPAPKTPPAAQRSRRHGARSGQSSLLRQAFPISRNAMPWPAVRFMVDVILTHNTPPVLATKHATSLIPIVFAIG
jgi:hypothetical protein